MPTRMVRASLLHSDRFLGLPDNTCRMAFVALLLTADDLGNLEASPGRLVRLWRDYGVDSTEKTAKISAQLIDHDLVRGYEADGKTYLHIPRFNQRVRHIIRACPLSPWNQGYQKPNDGRKTDDSQTSDSLTTAEVKRSEEKGSEEKRIIGGNSKAQAAIKEAMAILKGKS